MSDDTNTTTLVLPTKPVDLDKLDGAHLADGQNGTQFRFDANSLTVRVRQMFAHLDGLEKERSMKAILCGIYLAEIKAKTPHGEFTAWLATNFQNSARRAQHYMALAAKFSRSSKLLLPELIAANQISLALEAPDATGEALMAKLGKFVGNHGLTDLLRKHGIVKQGGNQRPDTPALAGPAKEPTAEELAEAEERAAGAAFQSASDLLSKAETVLLGEVVWASLTLQSAELLEARLKSLHTKFHERVLQARHEAN